MITFNPGNNIPPPGVTLNADLSLTLAPTKADMQQVSTFVVTYTITLFLTEKDLEETVSIT